VVRSFSSFFRTTWCLLSPPAYVYWSSSLFLLLIMCLRPFLFSPSLPRLLLSAVPRKPHSDFISPKVFLCTAPFSFSSFTFSDFFLSPGLPAENVFAVSSGLLYSSFRQRFSVPPSIIPGFSSFFPHTLTAPLSFISFPYPRCHSPNCKYLFPLCRQSFYRSDA